MKKVTALITVLLGICLSTVVLSKEIDKKAIPAYQQFGQTADQLKAKVQKNFGLDSSTFGWEGPLALSYNYSQLTGSTATLRYGNYLGNRNTAVGVEATYGAQEARLNVTLGLAISDAHRVKVTVERLMQQLNFEFASGDVERWVGQNAIGLAYEIGLPNQVLGGLEFGGYYAKAESTDLDTVTGFQTVNRSNALGETRAVLQDNYRRITGGQATGASVTAHLFPWAYSALDVTANYDKVAYDMKYDNTADNDSDGFGAGIKLTQHILPGVSTYVSASHRSFTKEYAGGLSLAMFKGKSSHVAVSLENSYIDNQGSVPSTNVTSVNVSFVPSAAPKTMPAMVGNKLGDLLAWVKQPAVRMTSVLAVADEAVLDQIQESGEFEPQYVQLMAGQVFVSYANFVGKGLTYTISANMMDNPAATKGVTATKGTPAVKALQDVNQWVTYDAQNKILTGTVPSVEQHSILEISVTATDEMHNQATRVFHIEAVPNQSAAWQDTLRDQTLTIGQDFSLDLKNYVTTASNVTPIFKEANLPSWMTLSSEGVLSAASSAIPTTPVKDISITLQVAGADGIFDTKKININTVLAAPTWKANPTVGPVTLGQAQELPLSSLVTNAPGATALHFALAGTDIPSWLSVSQDDLALKVSESADFHEPLSLTMLVWNENGQQVQGKVTLISEVAPVAWKNGSTTFVLDPATAGNKYQYDLAQLVDAPLGSGTLTFTSSDLPNWLAIQGSSLATVSTGYVPADTEGVHFHLQVASQYNTTLATPASLEFSISQSNMPRWNQSLNSQNSDILTDQVTTEQHYENTFAGDVVAPQDSHLTYAVAAGSTLPGTLDLNANTGEVKGDLPAAAGTYQFALTVTNTLESGGKLSATSAPYEIIVQPKPQWGSVTLSTGVVGQAYTQIDLKNYIENLPANYEFSAPTDALHGLTLTSVGLLSGTPTAATENNAILPLSLSAYGQTYTLSVPLNIKVGDFSWNVTALNFTQEAGGVFSQDLMSYIAVPAGAGQAIITIDPDTVSTSSEWLEVSGTLLHSKAGIFPDATKVGTYTFNLIVRGQNQENGVSIPVTFRVTADNIPVWNTFDLSSGTVGVPYNDDLSASNLLSEKTFSLVSGTTLPAGLVLDTATGNISGTPTTACAACTVTFRVTNITSAGASVSMDITKTITINPAPVWNADFDAISGTAGDAVNIDLQTKLSNAPSDAVFSISPSAVNGLTLSGSLLQGNLAAVGTDNLIVTMSSDSLGNTYSKSISVLSQAPSFDWDSAKTLNITVNRGDAIASSGDLSNYLSVDSGRTVSDLGSLTFGLSSNKPSFVKIENGQLVANGAVPADAPSSGSFTLSATAQNRPNDPAANKTVNYTVTDDNKPVWNNVNNAFANLVVGTQGIDLSDYVSQGHGNATLTYSSDLSASVGTLSATGIVDIASSAAAGDYTATFTVTADNGAGSDTQTVNFTLLPQAVWATPAPLLFDYNKLNSVDLNTYVDKKITGAIYSISCDTACQSVLTSAGLSLSNGLISGASKKIGSYTPSFTLTSNGVSTSQAFALIINAPTAVNWKQGSLDATTPLDVGSNDITVNLSSDIQLPQGVGLGDVTYSGLPGWLTIGADGVLRITSGKYVPTDLAGDSYTVDIGVAGPAQSTPSELALTIPLTHSQVPVFKKDIPLSLTGSQNQIESQNVSEWLENKASLTGTVNVSFSALPAGISLRQDATTKDWFLEGTPTHLGNINASFTVTNTVASGAILSSGALPITFSVESPLSWSTTLTNLAGGSQGVAYIDSLTRFITAYNTVTSANLSFACTGLPAGLTLNTATGAISGTPTVAFSGTVSCTYTYVSDNVTDAKTSNLQLQITPEAVHWTNTPFDFSVEAGNNTGNLNSGATSLLSNANLVSGIDLGSYVAANTQGNTPSGFTISAINLPSWLTVTNNHLMFANGVSYVPASAGNMTVNLSLINGAMPSAITIPLNITVGNANAPVWNPSFTIQTITANALSAQSGFAYTNDNPLFSLSQYAPAVSNGETLSYETVSTLPAGLSVDASSGKVIGSISSNASLQFKLKKTLANNAILYSSNSSVVTLNVVSAPSLNVIPAQSFQVSSPVSWNLSQYVTSPTLSQLATSGVTLTSITLTGTLPTGLTNSAIAKAGDGNYYLNWTPTATGSYNFQFVYHFGLNGQDYTVITNAISGNVAAAPAISLAQGDTFLNRNSFGFNSVMDFGTTVNVRTLSGLARYFSIPGNGTVTFSVDTTKMSELDRQLSASFSFNNFPNNTPASFTVTNGVISPSPIVLTVGVSTLPQSEMAKIYSQLNSIPSTSTIPFSTGYYRYSTYLVHDMVIPLKASVGSNSVTLYITQPIIFGMYRNKAPFDQVSPMATMRIANIDNQRTSSNNVTISYSSLFTGVSGQSYSAVTNGVVPQLTYTANGSLPSQKSIQVEHLFLVGGIYTFGYSCVASPGTPTVSVAFQPVDLTSSTLTSTCSSVTLNTIQEWQNKTFKGQTF